MPKKDLTLASKILIWCLAVGDLARPFIDRRVLVRKMLYGNTRRNTFDVTIYRLYQRGWIKFEDKNGKRFLKLTKNGQIEALLAKARMPEIVAWDGKWRILFFDIPESTKESRNLLRGLLKRAGFRKLQASAYISPYPLNREAINYLKQTHLIEYIRIAKVEEMDDDKDLRKMFSLKK